jgi:hypothetical protein
MVTFPAAAAYNLEKLSLLCYYSRYGLTPKRSRVKVTNKPARANVSSFELPPLACSAIGGRLASLHV